MTIFLTLAWRNIWRNRRRTLITLASVSFSVVFALVTRSMQKGSYRYITRNAVSSSTGYAQIQKSRYWKHKSLDESFRYAGPLRQAVQEEPRITLAVPKLTAFCLASSGELTRGVMVCGIDPEKENAMTGLKKKLVRGDYLDGDDSGIMLSGGLSRYLEADVGDTVVLLGQGYHGMTAAGKYTVSGIIEFPTPAWNARMAYLSLETASELFSLDGRVSAMALMVEDGNRLSDILESLEKRLPDGYLAKPWHEMLPELVQSIKIDNAGGIIMLGILYMVIGFGMLGTLLMMTAERRREFAILMASGMKRRILSCMVLVESWFIAFSGVVAGLFAVFPFLVYFHFHPIPLTGKAAEGMLKFGFDPILPFSLEPWIFVSQGLSVFFIAAAVSLVPLFMIFRIRIASTLRA